MTSTRRALQPVDPAFFATPGEFRAWLEDHHATADELWVGFHKKGTGRPSLTWPESVDEALCFGWIDGLRRSLDADRYVIRFTPRRRGSTWSAVNTRRVAELTRLGRMRPAGLAAFAARDAARSGIYSFEQRGLARFTPAETKAFKAVPSAWRFFSSQPAGYQRIATWWVISAKREATRARRLQTVIDDSAAGRRIGPLRRREDP